MARGPQARSVLRGVNRIGEPAAPGIRRPRERHRVAPVAVLDVDGEDRAVGKLDEQAVEPAR